MVDVIHLTATAVAAAVLIAELVIILCDVTQRQFLSRSFLWSDESAKLSLSTFAFIGGAAAYRSRQHTSVRVLLDLMPGPLCDFVLAVLEWAVVVVAVIAGWQGLLLMEGNWQTLTPILQISTGWIALPLPIGMALVALFALERLGLQHRPGIAASALLLVVGGTAALMLYDGTAFFGLHLPLLAVFVIAALLALVAWTIKAFWRVDRIAAGLLMPYLAWVAYAGWLTAGFWWLNRA